MTLRTATLPDLADLVDAQEAGAVIVLAHIFPQETYPFPRAEVQSRWAEEMADPAIDAYVADGDRGLIDAFVALRGDELLHFGTAIRAWGTGLAARVHAECVEKLAVEGHSSAWLRVFEENRRARRFYEKMGAPLLREDGLARRRQAEPKRLRALSGARGVPARPDRA